MSRLADAEQAAADRTYVEPQVDKHTPTLHPCVSARQEIGRSATGKDWVCTIGQSDREFALAVGETESEAWDRASRIAHAWNSHTSLLCTVKELMEALEEAWDIMKHGPAQSGHIEASESRAFAALSRARSLMEQKP